MHKCNIKVLDLTDFIWVEKIQRFEILFFLKDLHVCPWWEFSDTLHLGRKRIMWNFKYHHCFLIQTQEIFLHFYLRWRSWPYSINCSRWYHFLSAGTHTTSITGLTMCVWIPLFLMQNKKVVSLKLHLSKSKQIKIPFANKKKNGQKH